MKTVIMYLMLFVTWVAMGTGFITFSVLIFGEAFFRANTSIVTFLASMTSWCICGYFNYKMTNKY